MFHELLRVWFHWVEAWGYSGVFVLMVLESSIVPVPSEIVVPPAAFWAAQGRMSFAGVILVATLGSYVGSILNYYVFRWIGQPMAMKYGKYVLLPQDKLLMAEEWLKRFGTPGIFAARFLPVVRHLISIPAGILRMPVAPFTLATVMGAGAWCAILAWFGQEVLGSHPELLDSPEAMVVAMKAKLAWIVVAMLAFLALYAVVVVFKRKTAEQAV